MNTKLDSHLIVLELSDQLYRFVADVRTQCFRNTGNSSFRALFPCIVLGYLEKEKALPSIPWNTNRLIPDQQICNDNGLAVMPFIHAPQIQELMKLFQTHSGGFPIPHRPGIFLGSETTLPLATLPPPLTSVKLSRLELTPTENWQTCLKWKRLTSFRLSDRVL